MKASSNRINTLTTLYYSRVDFAFITTFSEAMKAAFIVGLITHLGGSEFWINLSVAISSIIGILQVPGTFIARTLPSYKPFVLYTQAAWRLLHIPLIFLPFLPVPTYGKLSLLVFFLAIASAGYQISMPVLNEWLSQIVPPSSRGWFFSKRNSVAAGVSACVGLLGGLLIDYFKSIGQTSLGYSVLFTILILAASLSLLNYRKMSDHPRERIEKFYFRDMLNAFTLPVHDYRLRQFLYFSMAFTSGLYFTGNLYTAYGLKLLHMPISFFQITGMAQGLGYILSAKMWGFLADKYGNKPTLVIISIGSFFTPLGWFFCYPDNLVHNLSVLITTHLLSGLFWCGAITCQLNLLFAVSNKDRLSEAITVGMFIQALVTGLAPFTAGILIVQLMEHLDVTTSYYIIFAIGMSFRLLAAYLVTRVDEEGSIPIKETLKQLKSLSPKGYKAFRDLAKSSDVKTREKAIASVGLSQLTLVTDVVIKALKDPAPRVRRQAAVTLGRLNQPDGTNALIDILLNYPDLVENETVEALGTFGNKTAVDSLIAYLENPKTSLRRSAAKALGRIGDHRAVPYLLNITQESSDPDLKRSVLQSLRILEASEGLPLVTESLHDEATSVRIAAAEAVSELELYEAAPMLREALINHIDESSSEICYALGCVGKIDDIPLMLIVAKNTSNPVSRRRCILGIAKLLKCESIFYSFLLLEGMDKDSTILDLFGNKIKTSKRLKQSLDAYYDGNETEALDLVSQYAKDEIISNLADNPIEDTYLLAISYLSNKWHKKK